jgi:CubicO group peptidase (beta-lactamase class C family)
LYDVLIHAQGERLSHVDPLHDAKWTTYSNATYDLAVEIVERLVGMPYGDFVHQAILAPLSMSDSSYTTERSTDVAPMAAGWHKVVDANGWKPSVFRLEHRLDQMGEKVGMGGIRFISTAEDMVRVSKTVVRSLTRRQCAYLKHLSANPAYQDACAPRLLHSGRASCRFPHGDVEYGLGVTIASSRGIPIVGHTGACSGFRSYAGRFPAQDIGVAVLINSTNGDELHALIRIHILGIILREDLSHLEDR